jgi:adenine-specific DNA-methyltransferase
VREDEPVSDTVDLPEKLDLTSEDVAATRRAELLRLFPEARTEGGKVDFDRLRLALGDTVDVGRERYGMTWPGKAECFRTIQTPSLGTLRPCREESVNFDTTENLIIEGDNLEVLKLLQKSYLGQVKMIYIDPPYNTGNDFIYPDNYTESLRTYLEYTGQVDAEGRKFGTNTEADGRFHSKWLNMMYPRLYLARNLLKDDGLLFVSCNDVEVENLRRICDEIFGEENFVAHLIWKKSYGGGAKTNHVVVLHEYVVVYARAKASLGRLELPPNPAVRKYYKYRDAKFDVRGPYRLQPLATTSNDERENLRYPIPYQGEEIWPEKQWQWERSRTFDALKNDELLIAKSRGEWVVNYKQYLYDEDGNERGAKPFSVLDGPYTQVGTAELAGLLGDTTLFPFPKPSELIRHFLDYANPEKDFLFIDFFAGSGSSAQAVLERNQLDGGRRRFILVQLPEPTGREDYHTIADVTQQRTRRVVEKIRLASDDRDKPSLFEGAESVAPPDLGFRVYKLGESNLRSWHGTISDDSQVLAKQLELHVVHLRQDRTTDDLLFELLLKSGYKLTENVVRLDLAGKTVYSVAGGNLFVCLDRDLTLDLIRAMAERKPVRVVCLDVGFAGNDQLKANAVQIFKTKGVTSFKTV